MFNQQIVLGRLGSEPEMRYTPQGTPVTTVSVAANYSFTKADGQKSKETEWFNVQAWGKLAEVCNQWLKKGSLVLVLGRTRTQTWTGEEGQKHSRRLLVADRVIFVDLKNGAAEQTDLGAAANEAGEPARDEPGIPF